MFIRKLLFGNNTKEIEENSNKWQNKLHLVQINPEPDLDLTDCGIKCLPKGIYSQCRIFRKNRLLLNDNCLSTLPDDNDNNLTDLSDLCTFLDLSRNKLTCLPPSLGKLANLKELYLSHNMIRNVPESFANMTNLKTINISHNQLDQFPHVFCDMTNLKEIDISYNQLITQLPSKICNLIKLEKLVIAGTNIKHPPKRICDQGIESLYKFFNNAQLVNDGINHAEKFPPNRMISETKPSSELKKDNLQSYLAKKDDRKKRLIEFEKNLLDKNKLMEATNRKMIDKRQEILMKMKQDQLMLHEGLESLFAKKVEDKSSIVKALALIEQHSSQLVEQLKSLHLKQSSNDHGDTSESNIYNQEQLIDTLEEKLRELMISKDLTKESLQSELIKQDESLYQAICTFIDMKDTQSRILSEQIGLIEHELYHLTKAEIQRRSNNLDQQMTDFNGQRVALASFLKDLIDERNSKLNQRENDSSILSNFIGRVTSSMTNNQSNEDLDKEAENEPHLNQLLDALDLSLSRLYAPLLTNGSITIQQLADSTNDQLKSLGIKEQHIPVIRKHIDLCLPGKRVNSPSAPQLDEINPNPSAPPMKLYQLVECVVCLDEQSKIILIPCGHVCTCDDCSKSLELCPLCRSEINEKIQSN